MTAPSHLIARGMVPYYVAFQLYLQLFKGNEKQILRVLGRYGVVGSDGIKYAAFAKLFRLIQGEIESCEEHY